MRRIAIAARPGFEEWRHYARECFCADIPPTDIDWQDSPGAAGDLFADDSSPLPPACGDFSVPRAFLDMAALAACHASPERFTLLYRILWRLKRGEPHVLQLKTDSDVMALNRMVKAVRRDAYKIKAFLRFREVTAQAGEAFVAWYEPEHYTLELSLPFFQTRFKNMTWSILTPYLAAHWDRQSLTLSANPDPAIVPAQDKIEDYWLKYYATTFNPARPKKAAMLNQMPKKYWKNMPETVLIPELLRGAGSRAARMIKDGQG